MKTPNTNTLLLAAGVLTLCGLLGLFACLLDAQSALDMIAWTLGGAPLVGMAVTANQVISRQESMRSSRPVYELIHIYEGTLVFVNSSGYATDVVNSGANPFAGIAIKEADNSAGASGAVNVELWEDGAFVMVGSGFTQGTVGLDIYASDNFTVTTTATSTSYVGRCIGYISSTKILVQIRRNAPTLPTAANGTGTTAATWTVDTDLGKPKMALGSQTGGTGDFSMVLKPAATLGASRDITLGPDAAGSLFTDAVFAATPNSSEGAGNSIPVGYKSVAVGTVANNADDFIVLPAIASCPIGHTIVIACNAAGNFELRTPASSGTKINDVDSDGTQEYLCTDTDVIIVRKATTTGWVAQSLTKLGAVRTAVVPD